MIKDVNMIVSFPYTDEDLAQWTQTIFRLYPNVTIDVIARLTDNFLKGEETFVRDIGILNYTTKINSYLGYIK